MWLVFHFKFQSVLVLYVRVARERLFHWGISFCFNPLGKYFPFPCFSVTYIHDMYMTYDMYVTRHALLLLVLPADHGLSRFRAWSHYMLHEYCMTYDLYVSLLTITASLLSLLLVL